MPGQFLLQYFVDETTKKLKGSIDLDQCEQVGVEAVTLVPGLTCLLFFSRLILASHSSTGR